MLYGKGANGKGTLINLVKALLGDNNCSHRSLQEFHGIRFAKADLYVKLAFTFADLKSIKLSEIGNFKMLTSGDDMSTEEKFKNRIDTIRLKAS